jgi:hypothetical protein
MTKAISSYPEDQRKAVVARRLAEKKGGLGYLAALDYQRKKAASEKVKVVLPIEDKTVK